MTGRAVPKTVPGDLARERSRGVRNRFRRLRNPGTVPGNSGIGPEVPGELPEIRVEVAEANTEHSGSSGPVPRSTTDLEDPGTGPGVLWTSPWVPQVLAVLLECRNVL